MQNIDVCLFVVVVFFFVCVFFFVFLFCFFFVVVVVVVFFVVVFFFVVVVVVFFFVIVVVFFVKWVFISLALNNEIAKMLVCKSLLSYQFHIEWRSKLKCVQYLGPYVYRWMI